MISISQMRAARALLNWTQQDLSKASGISLRALNSIERGLVAPRVDNLRFIQEAFEKHNIEFGDNDGVRRRTERLDIIKFEGKNFLDKHLLDIMQEITAKGSEILFSVSSEKDFAMLKSEVLDAYFAHLARYRISERILIPHGDCFVIGMPSTYRWAKAGMLNHVSYIVYGDNVAFHILSKPHRTIIIRNPGIADMFRRQFESNWQAAETPWFTKRYKVGNPNEPWTMQKAKAAQDWIAKASR